jgi:polyhydroxyalkanoate synthesis regulator phasin
MGGLFDGSPDEIESEGQAGAISPVDLLELSPELGVVIRKVIRENGLRLADIAGELNQAVEQVQQVLDELVAKGYLQQVEINQEIWYKAHFKRRAQRKISDVWSQLGKSLDQEEDTQLP